MAATCILCPIYRPDTEPRQPDRPPVCEGDRWRLSRDIADLANLHARLINPDPLEIDARWYRTTYQTWDNHSKTWTRHNEKRRADPLAAIGGAGPVPGHTNQPHVAGSKERPLPIPVDAVDLTARARQPEPSAAARRHPEDQHGHISVATILDQWARDWRDTLWPNQHLPVPTVPELVAWFRVGADPDTIGARIDDACDRHPAIDDMAAEIRDLRYALRRALGETEPQPEHIQGVACRNCDLRTLFRRPGDIYRAECGACGLLYTDAEFTDWVERLSGFERSTRTAEEVREILRHA